LARNTTVDLEQNDVKIVGLKEPLGFDVQLTAGGMVGGMCVVEKSGWKFTGERPRNVWIPCRITSLYVR